MLNPIIILEFLFRARILEKNRFLKFAWTDHQKIFISLKWKFYSELYDMHIAKPSELNI